MIKKRILIVDRHFCSLQTSGKTDEFDKQQKNKQQLIG